MKKMDPTIENTFHFSTFSMKLYIKNMVCNRCIIAVENVLKQQNLTASAIILGEVILDKELSEKQYNHLNTAFEDLGFEILEDKKSQLMEHIKGIIIDVVQNHNGVLQTNLSTYLSAVLQQEYNYVSNLFSDSEGITIEKYFIVQKIEKVKELLAYDEMTLSEIAYQMDYSSVAYLSNQFKKVTGMTTTIFKKKSTMKRTALDQL